MKGAIFYASKYGSTAQYAYWLSEATGLPVFNIKDKKANPTTYDFLILGSPILYFRLSIRNWVKKYLPFILYKPIIFFSVSGSPAGSRLNGWIEKSLPGEFISKMDHFALRGRQIPANLSVFDRMMLRVGALFNRDSESREQEVHGFDFMDKDSIAPIVAKAQSFQQMKASA